MISGKFAVACIVSFAAARKDTAVFHLSSWTQFCTLREGVKHASAVTTFSDLLLRIEKAYPEAKKIFLIVDNTHREKSLRTAFG